MSSDNPYAEKYFANLVLSTTGRILLLPTTRPFGSPQQDLIVVPCSLMFQRKGLSYHWKAAVDTAQRYIPHDLREH